MLVSLDPRTAARRWTAAAWLAGLLLALALLSLAPYLGSSSELVRLRNAWLLSDQPGTDFGFSPERMPADFLVEQRAPEPLFVDVVRGLQLDALPDDWDRAARIARHLLAHSDHGEGGANQTDLKRSYQAIIDHGEGYCADLVRAFTALANAAGLSTRLWAFSFDGFGGHGHVWVELWNRQRQRLQLIDVYNNAYFVDSTSDEPLSALALRSAMQQRPGSLRMLRIAPDSPPGYVHPDKAWAYYRRGLAQWYMWWGNNPNTFDQALLVRSLTPVSYTLGQLGGLVQGLYPRIRVLATPDNAPQLAAMRRLRQQIGLVMAVGGGAALVWAVSLAMAWRARRRAAAGAAR